MSSLIAVEDLPYWVRLETGKRMFRSGEFGQALIVFTDLRESRDSFPEADFWIGRIYEEEGELGLAESMYLRALESRRDLYVYEDVLTIQGALANLYRISRQYYKYENMLKESLKFSAYADDAEMNRRRHLMTRTLKDQGIDKLFELYRIHDSKVLHVHSELGLFYYRTGRYQESLRHLVHSILGILTVFLEEIHHDDPLYEPDSVSDMLMHGLSLPVLAQWSRDVSLFPLLYYLGASLYADGSLRESRTMFTLVANMPQAGEWRHRAGRQLTSPFIEPVLTSQEYFYF